MICILSSNFQSLSERSRTVADMRSAEEGKMNGTQSFTASSLAEAMLSLGGPALHQDLLEHARHKYPIMNRMPGDSEGALTLCGAIECLQRPLVAFVRLAEGYR